MAEVVVDNKRTWRNALIAVTTVSVILLLLFQSTVAAMVNIWWRSETFAHGFFILPISLYLIWRLRDVLSTLRPEPTWRALPLMLVLGFGWLLGHFASVGVVQQLALVAMLLVAVYSVLGHEVTKRITFPLLFLIFAVPMGEGLIPPLMDFTADFTVLMLQLSGIPVYREGLFFEIPSGRWSVVEGCSGVRYLIASVTLGCLYAYLTYSSWTRRSVFILASFIIPVFANGMRAYMIVMIAHYSDYKLAMGVDHFIYGWVWFGIVITLMFWVGSYWRQNEDEPVMTTGSAVVAADNTKHVFFVSGAVLILAMIWPSWAGLSDASVATKAPVLIAPQAANWQSAANFTEWRPEYKGADAELEHSYIKNGQRVALHIEYYRRQRQDAELINSQNVLVRQKHPLWQQVEHRPVAFLFADKTIDVWRARLRASHGQKLAVVYWYWLGDEYTTNRYWAKWLEAKAKLLGQPRDGAAIILATEYDAEPEQGFATLQQFVDEMLPVIQQQLDQAVAQ